MNYDVSAYGRGGGLKVDVYLDEGLWMKDEGLYDLDEGLFV